MRYNFFFFCLFLVSVLAQSCSTQNKVAFGNRKFYPDPKPHPVVTSVNPINRTPKDTVSLARQVEALAKHTLSDQNPLIGISEMARKPVDVLKAPCKSVRTLRFLGRGLLAKSLSKESVEVTNDDRRTPGIAVAGFILGILSLFIAGIILGVMAVIFSAIALSKDSAEYKKGLAVAGLILGIIGIVGALIFLATM